MPAAGAQGRGSGPLVVVSPHLYDAVFSCGELLAQQRGATVITVFASGPSPLTEVTPWDAAAGFVPGDDVFTVRRREDDRALSQLGAMPVWLDYWEGQYGRSASPDEICGRLSAALTELEPGMVAIPLGLSHADHRLAHDAAVRLVRSFPDAMWLAYEEAIYRRMPDAGLDQRLSGLRDTARLTSHRAAHRAYHASPLKRLAMSHYRSQLLALSRPGNPGYDDALLPERLWRLVPS